MSKTLKGLLAAACAAVVLITMLSGCQMPLKRYSISYTDTFDTVTVFSAYCSSYDEFSEAANAVHAELLRLHSVFDIYSETSSVYRLNSESKLESADKELIELTALGKEYYNLSGGKLNIAAGSLLRLWHQARAEDVLPNADALIKAAEHIDISKVAISDDDIIISDPDLTLDFGALAKGYAADKAAEKAIECGLTSFLLDLGGNIKAVGKKPDGEYWTVGIKNPDVKGEVDSQILTAVNALDVSVVTSGDYERFFEVDGKRYSHIIDPDTFYPAQLYRSVTVIAAESKIADALSTSLFCMSLEDGKALAKSLDAQVMWVTADGICEKTEGFIEYEKK